MSQSFVSIEGLRVRCHATLLSKEYFVKETGVTAKTFVTILWVILRDVKFALIQI